VKHSLAKLLLVLPAVVSGCVDPNGSASLARSSAGSVADVDNVTVMSMPAAVNLDDAPEADGVRLQVLLFQLAKPQPVKVAGTLRFLLYEKRISPDEVRTRKPSLVWTYSGQKLARHVSKTRVGWGYAMELRWGSRRPTSRLVSVVAEYQSPRGKSIYSRPVTIPLTK